MNDIEKLRQMGLLEQVEKLQQLEQNEQINVNDVLTMQLTLEGVKTVKEHYDAIRPRANADIGEPKISSIGLFECTLEEFVQIFGDKIGLENYFEQIFVTKNDEMQRIDLNDSLTIKLTLDGITTIKEYYDEVEHYAAGVKRPKIDSLGMFECKFKEFVEIFGNEIGLEDCFEKIYVTQNEQKAKSR